MEWLLSALFQFQSVREVPHYDMALKPIGIVRAPTIVETEEVPQNTPLRAQNAPNLESLKPKCKSLTQEGCSCVAYLRTKGIQISGDAKNFGVNYLGTPYRGDIAKFIYSGNVHHLAYVEWPLHNGNFLISEWNWKEGQYTERVITKDDKYLVGFIHRISN